MYSRIAKQCFAAHRILARLTLLAFLALALGADAARAAQSLAVSSLVLFPAPGVPCAPYEVPIKGVSSATDWAALTVQLTPSTPSLHAEIDPVRRVLRFTPPELIWWTSNTSNFTLKVLSNRYPSAQPSLALQIKVGYDDFTPQAIEYTEAGSPVALVNNSLVVYPQGRRENEIAICLPAAPTDFALSSDGAHAYVLYSSLGTMQVVDLATLRLGATTRFANFAKSAAYPVTTRGRIALGREGQIFTLDEQSVIRRHHPTTGAVLQTLPAAAQNLRWIDIAANPERTLLWAHASSAGFTEIQTTLFRAPLDTKGAAGAFSPATQSTGPTARNYGAPDSCRILQSRDGRILAVDQGVYAVTPSGDVEPRRDLPNEACSLTVSGALLGLARGGVCDLAADRVFTAQTAGAYYSTLPPIYFFGGTYLSRSPFRASQTSPYGAEVLPSAFQPGSGKVVLPSARLAWPAFPGSSSTQVELHEVARPDGALDPALMVINAETTENEIALAAPLRSGSTYEWRLRPGGFSSLSDEDFAALDADFDGSFTVSDAVPSPQNLDLETIEGLPAYDVPLQISTATPETAWTLQSDATWLVPLSTSGVGGATITVRIDASALSTDSTPTRSGSLTLSTGAGIARIPVALTVRRPTYSKLVPHPTDSRCFALAETAWSRPPWLVEIDTATRRITRGIPAPANADTLLYHPDDDTIYLRSAAPSSYEGSPRLHAVALPDLSLRTIGDIPRSDTFTPAGPGRILFPIYNGASNPCLLLDTASGTSAPGPLLDYARCLVSRDGKALYRFIAGHFADQGYQTRIEKISLTAPSFPVLATQTAPGPEYGWLEYAFFGPDRLLVEGREFDLDLNPLPAAAPAYSEVPSALASGPLRLAQSLAYDAASPASPRIVAPATRAKTLNPATGCFVAATSDAGRLRFASWDELSPAAVPTISVATRTAFSVVLNAAGVPDYSQRVVSYRTAGVEEWKQPYYGNAVVNQLTPDTAYEFRMRYMLDGVSSAWSETLSVRTLIAPPHWDYTEDYSQSKYGLAGSAFSYVVPVSGPEVSISVQDLPPGLVFDPATRTISGTPTAGRHTIKIIAQNSTGTLETSVRFFIEAVSSRVKTARYAGLIDLTTDAGPLIGQWKATRSGDTVTGTYRSALFALPFKINLSNTGDEPLVIHGYGICNYLGVDIYLTARWDKAQDRLSLSGYTSDLVENYYFQTAEDQGYAGHWAAATNPYPHATRYTGLLVAADDATDGPDGHGFLSVTIKPDGTVSTTGETALGHPFTQSTWLSDLQLFPFFRTEGDFLMVGEMGIEQLESGPRLLGAIDWAKDVRPNAPAYPSGFEQSLIVIGAPLPPTGKTLPPLAPLANSQNRADLVLSDGALGAFSKPIEQALVPGDAGLIAPKAGRPANPNQVALKLDAKTGLVTGTAVILDAATQTKAVRTIAFRGMLVKDPLGDGEDVIGGYFRLPDKNGRIKSGLFEITEPQPEASP